jgi:long-subunit acyl-CoA synthetase (AMP-forming)
VSCYLLTTTDAELNRGNIIGEAIPDLSIYILDEYGQPVPTGVVGELYVGGAGVGRGYFQRPELTRQKFLPDTFTGRQQRIYRSGDLVRLRHDGKLEYYGRSDRQVKIRGFRIEPGEIEACLASHPAIAECVVQTTAEQSAAAHHLVAYLVSHTQPVPTANELCHLLQKQLPEYMIPTEYIYLDALPLTVNGKLDQQKLLKLAKVEANVQKEEKEYNGPEDEIEHKVAQVWQKVLKVEQVGRDQNFLELGGNSLLLSEIHLQLCQVFQQKFPLVTLFHYPTIQSFADFLRQEQPASDVLEEGRARARGRQVLLRQRQQRGRVQ